MRLNRFLQESAYYCDIACGTNLLVVSKPDAFAVGQDERKNANGAGNVGVFYLQNSSIKDIILVFENCKCKLDTRTVEISSLERRA